jgi:hypothetical protein
MITRDQLNAAVVAFQEAYEDCEEYGITDEDAHLGLLFALEALGIETDLSDAAFKRRKAELAREAALWQAYHERRAGMTQKERDDEDDGQRALMPEVLRYVFKTSPLFNSLRDPK